MSYPLDACGAEKYTMGGIDIAIEGRQIVQGCNGDSSSVGFNGSRRGTVVVFRRHWQQGVFCRYAFYLLRPPSSRCRRGVCVAAWLERLLYALPDSNAENDDPKGTALLSLLRASESMNYYPHSCSR